MLDTRPHGWCGEAKREGREDLNISGWAGLLVGHLPIANFSQDNLDPTFKLCYYGRVSSQFLSICLAPWCAFFSSRAEGFGEVLVILQTPPTQPSTTYRKCKKGKEQPQMKRFSSVVDSILWKGRLSRGLKVETAVHSRELHGGRNDHTPSPKLSVPTPKNLEIIRSPTFSSSSSFLSEHSSPIPTLSPWVGAKQAHHHSTPWW